MNQIQKEKKGRHDENQNIFWDIASHANVVFMHSTGVKCIYTNNNLHRRTTVK